MTMGEWSCKKPVWPRPIRRAAWLVAAAAVLCGAPRARAGHNDAPDWLRAAAAEKLPDYPKDTKAVVLLDDVQTTVQSNGEIDTRYRRAIRLLRPEARQDYRGVSVDFDKETKILSLKAWTIEATGQVLAVGEKDAMERSFFNGDIYEDLHEKVLLFSEPNPGNVVGYEYVQRHRPFVFEDDWRFQDTDPVRDARYSLALPVGWDFTDAWFNHPAVPPQDAGTSQHVWEVRDLPAIDIERDMPSWRSVAGWAGFKYFPNNPALRAKTTGSWTDVGLWYDSLTQSSRIASPQIKQKVAELTSGIADPIGKMRALTEFMQRNIRYYAIEIGIGGYQPHPAAEVFAHQYGDCKDKATLLSSMLHEIGIESDYVLIDTNRGFVHPSYPTIDFNHAILAIRLPDSVTDPSLYAVVNDPKLGRLLIFDPTNEFVPLGYLPSYLQDSFGLVAAPDGGHMIQMPLLPPSTNRLLRTAKLTLSPEGDLSGEITELRWGGPAADDRETFHDTEPAKRAQVFENFLGTFLDNFSLLGASIGNLDKNDETLVLDYKFLSRGYAKEAGDMLALPPRVVGDKYTNMLNLFTVAGKPRKFPVDFGGTTRQDDLFDITLPPGFSVAGLPAPVQADCAYADYHSETRIEAGVLHYKRTFEVKNVVVPVGKLPEIESFLQEIAADQSAEALLRRPNP